MYCCSREMLLLVLGALLLLFCSLDVWYFLRGAQVFIQAWFQPRIWDILAEQSIDGMVLPHDLDYMGHMNNSRYLRECDFARFHHYMRNGLFMASRKLGAKMVVGASTIRYRRSLAFREAFEIRTKVVGWDEKAFYLEQRFVSKKDGFVSAVMLCRQNVVHCSPERIIEFVCKKKVSNSRRIKYQYNCGMPATFFSLSINPLIIVSVDRLVCNTLENTNK